MGKEQDLLVAVKSGDLLLAHKLLSKVKCNKTSEYGANRQGDTWFCVITKRMCVCSVHRAWECSCFHYEIELRAGAIAIGDVVTSKPSAVSLR